LIRPGRCAACWSAGPRDAALALLAFRPADPGRYGRVLMRDGYVERVVEWIDAADAERATTLCNAGVLCAAATDMARWLNQVRADNAKGEYYLTDVVALARADGGRVAAVEAPADELAGINSRASLRLPRRWCSPGCARPRWTAVSP
jgi:bifunctional UDP-N-acetylglucosamine pyrophosphorylase/glucosamine-1-phosphate N-acetyltransferase